MSRIVWAFGWVGVAVWSVVCAIAYGFFDIVGRLSMRNADAFSSDPNTVEGIWRVFSALHSLSTWAILVGWALVSLLILAVPWVLDRMLGATREELARRGPATRVPGREGSEGVIDLGPDQYSVRPNPGPTGPAPRIAPRP